MDGENSFTITLDVEASDELDAADVERIIREALDHAPTSPYIDFSNVDAEEA